MHRVIEKTFSVYSCIEVEDFRNSYQGAVMVCTLIFMSVCVCVHVRCNCFVSDVLLDIWMGTGCLMMCYLTWILLRRLRSVVSGGINFYTCRKIHITAVDFNYFLGCVYVYLANVRLRDSSVARKKRKDCVDVAATFLWIRKGNFVVFLLSLWADRLMKRSVPLNPLSQRCKSF